MTKSDVKFFCFLESNTFSDNNSRNEYMSNHIQLVERELATLIKAITIMRFTTS